jgi:hypothetical protein
MDETQLLIRFVSRLNRHALGVFYAELASHGKNKEACCPVEPLPEAGENVFFQPYLDSYGSSIHDVILIHAPPLELFDPEVPLDMHDPVLIEKLVRVRSLYHGRYGSWGIVDEFRRRDKALKGLRFVTNLLGIRKSIYEDVLIPQYARLRRFCGIRSVETFVGSWDTFVELDPEGTRDALKRVAKLANDGVAISITANGPIVSPFQVERNVGIGVLPIAEAPYEPIVVGAMVQDRGVLEQFQSLLQREPLESEIESFLVANYKEVFGGRFDRIESQVWLKCTPETPQGKDRHLDVFLRNSVTSDWELFEIKRPIRLTTEYRSVPVVASEVSKAIQQTQNYLRILAKDSVKRSLAAMGIEYYEPVATVVIGRNPDIPLAEWKWLKSIHQHGPRILTFDELMSEWRSRLRDRYELLRKVSSYSVVAK